MSTNRDLIESGILEQYVLGNTSAEETMQVELMAAEDPLIREEIESISKALEHFAMAHAVDPDPVIKPFLMATIDYYERIKNGEPVSFPPLLNENSTIAEYATWLNRSDMVPSPDESSLFAKIIGHTPEATTAIIWIKDYSPHEVHDNEYERFLIVEGTCDIVVEDNVTSLIPGDYFSIPLHKTHLVKVTSTIPCKVILQRIAA